MWNTKTPPLLFLKSLALLINRKPCMTTEVFVGEKGLRGIKRKGRRCSNKQVVRNRCFLLTPKMLDSCSSIGSYIRVHRRHKQLTAHCEDVERTRRIWSSSTTSMRWVLNSTNCSKVVPSVNEVWQRSPERVSSSGSGTDPPPCETRRAVTFPVDKHESAASQGWLFWIRFDTERIISGH